MTDRQYRLWLTIAIAVMLVLWAILTSAPAVAQETLQTLETQRNQININLIELRARRQMLDSNLVEYISRYGRTRESIEQLTFELNETLGAIQKKIETIGAVKKEQ